MRVALMALVVLAAVVLIASGCGGAPKARYAPPKAGSAAATGPRQFVAQAQSSEPAAATRAQARALARFARLGLPVYCGGTRRRYAALTFDDGPGIYTGLALRILRAADVPATFFLVGRNLGEFGGWARREAGQGALGDHSWSHPVLSDLPPRAVRSQIARTLRALPPLAGAPVWLFRPPYGARNGVVDEVVRRLGLVQVLWTVDSRDSLGADWQGIARNVEAGLKPGSIILLHDNRGQTIRALKFVVLPHLRRHHIRLVTVPQLLALDPPTSAQLRAGPRGCGGPGWAPSRA